MDEKLIREHVHVCPLGWLDGKLIWLKGTTEAEVIEWIRELRRLVGLKPQYDDVIVGDGKNG